MEEKNLPDLTARLEQILDEVEGERSPSESPPLPAVPSESSAVLTVAPSEGSTAASSGASPLAGLLGNPALLSALPTLLENIGPLMGALSGGVGGGGGVTRPHAIDRHTALLCAVKPYLSPQRQSAADTVIRLCRIWDALERSGISLSGLLGSIPVGSGGENPEGR